MKSFLKTIWEKSIRQLQARRRNRRSAFGKRVERLEHRLADLSALAISLATELRRHAEHKEESLLGSICLRCGAPVVYDFYCEPHLPPKIRAIWEEIKMKEAKR